MTDAVEYHRRHLPVIIALGKIVDAWSVCDEILSRIYTHCPIYRCDYPDYAKAKIDRDEYFKKTVFEQRKNVTAVRLTERCWL